MIIDMHTHSFYSDGTLSPEDLVKEAAEVGLKYICLTDHDTLDGVLSIGDTKSRYGVELIPGVELTTRYAGMDFHILGMGIDVKDTKLKTVLAKMSGERLGRAKTMSSLLGKHGWEVDVSSLSCSKGIVTTHDIAKAVTNREVSAFDFHNEWLSSDSPCVVGTSSMPVKDAISIIQKAGGKAVCAHLLRTLGEHGQVDSLLKIASDMVDMGIDGFETFYGQSSMVNVSIMNSIADRYGLLKTGGSDYHGPGHKGRCPLGRYYSYGFGYDQEKVLQSVQVRPLLSCIP
ncbi:PHP domain-containing protein [Methanohalophilus mahii]|uniref:PHP domain protein n=1 Tax=Methanohalophilus mahii (strain ATCC 35705 / DSM 5219 / SLP) TaxID=547558 RepID=D5EBY8_METMS|nr:PHP domain-containing protein [Methanohalophilus mahii]ADE36689.1 PHP domain protein [Methanohalophilus mahii DSM 5219]